MCGEEKAEAEKSPLYDYKRAYFKIVQALIDDHRTAFEISPRFSIFCLKNFGLTLQYEFSKKNFQNFECKTDLDISQIQFWQKKFLVRTRILMASGKLLFFTGKINMIPEWYWCGTSLEPFFIRF